MNILKLLADLAETPTNFHQAASRRATLTSLGRAGAKTLAAALPLGLASLPAQARDTRTILDSLQLAVRLEQLQNAFYSRALTAPASFFPPDASFRASIVKMQAQQQQHVALLTRVIAASNGDAPTLPTYDFTGSKNNTQAPLFPNVFSNFDEFLRLAQLLEDTSVRAYKAAVEFLVRDNYILQTALQLHSTEARHAARIRTMRRLRGATVKPWPSPTDADITVAGKTAVVYATEHATTQLLPAPTYTPIPFRLLPIGSGANLLTQSVPEAFDEPLTADEADTFLNLFTL